MGDGMYGNRALCDTGNAILPIRIQLSNSMPVDGGAVQVGEIIVNRNSCTRSVPLLTKK